MLSKFNERPGVPEYATHLDGWANSLTGIGTERDKVMATGFTIDGRLPFQMLEELYHNDDVAARICDLLPETALREEWRLKDDGLARDMYALGACDAFENAWIFGRAYGGAAVIMGRGGNSEEPATAPPTSLYVADRWALSVNSFYVDSSSPKYGTPQTYRILRPILSGPGQQAAPQNPGDTIIHESRVIVFPGARTSPRRRLANWYWDDSVLQRVYSIVQAYGITWASVVHLLQDAAQGVFSIKDLWNMISSGQKDIVQERMKTVDEQRSSGRAITIDADSEEFTRVPTPFTSIPELIDRMSERLSSATGYPLTILMGSSPAGMNATGKSDLEIFYGRVRKQQQKIVTPAVRKLAEAMGQKDVLVSYPPLWMPSDEEISKTRYATAQSDNLYFQMGVLLPEEIRKSRFKTTGYSLETEIDPNATTHVPTPAAAPGAKPAAGAPGGSPVAESPGAFVGSHHFSPKYGR